MGSAWRLIAASLLSFPGACGSSGSGAPAGADGFQWTEGGKTMVATNATYSVDDLFDGSTFTLTVQGITPSGMTCTLLGQFAAAVPPPAGTYPVVPIFDGNAPASRPDASFGAECEPGAQPDGGNVLDPAVSGQVVLTTSAPGGVAGTFSMEAALFPTAGSATTSFNGKFKVGCLTPGSTPLCGPLSQDGAGTCADLLACCAASPACMTAYRSVAPNGDAACGRELAAHRASYCP